MSLHSLDFQNYLKVSCTAVQLLASYKWLIGHVQGRYFAYLYKQFTAWTISALFTTGNRLISIFKSSQVRENSRILRTNSENLSLKFCSSRVALGTKICIVSLENQNRCGSHSHGGRHVHPQDLSSPGWRTREAGGVIRSKSEGLRKGER